MNALLAFNLSWITDQLCCILAHLSVITHSVLLNNFTRAVHRDAHITFWLEHALCQLVICHISESVNHRSLVQIRLVDRIGGSISSFSLEHLVNLREMHVAQTYLFTVSITLRIYRHFKAIFISHPRLVHIR